MSTASRYHLHFDAGTEHVLPLSFVDEFGQALDVSCYEVSGVVLQQGKRLPVKATRPSATTAVISFPVLSSGVANYRLDMTSPAGTEIPMVFGTIHVMSRETEASGTGELDALAVAIPTVSEQDVTIKVLGVLDLAEFGAGIKKSVEELKAGLAEHAKDALVHASAEEKAAWNAKLSPAEADERYGYAGSIPGQEVNGQSFSTNFYFTGNRVFAKSVDFESGKMDNLVLMVDVDNKRVTFNGAEVYSSGVNVLGTVFVDNTLDVAGGAVFGGTATFHGTTRFSKVAYFDFAAEFAGAVTAHADFDLKNRLTVLPLGKKTALGADAYGLSVSADGGLQLFGNHFMLSDGWSDTALKVVNNAVSLTSTDDASLSFDYANNVHFRTMPNDGDGHGVYSFECYKWADDSHTLRVKGSVDVQKADAKTLSDYSLLNYSELKDKFLALDNQSHYQAVSSHVAYEQGLTANYVKVGAVPLYEGRVNGGKQALQVGNENSLDGLYAHDGWFNGYVRAKEGVKLLLDGDNATTVTLTVGRTIMGGMPALKVDFPIVTNCIVECCHMTTGGSIWELVGTSLNESAYLNFDYINKYYDFSHTVKAPAVKIQRNELLSNPAHDEVLTVGENDGRYLEINGGLDQTVESVVTFNSGVNFWSSINGSAFSLDKRTNDGKGFESQFGFYYSPGGLTIKDHETNGFNVKLYRSYITELESTDVLNKGEIGALINERVNAILAEKGLI